MVNEGTQIQSQAEVYVAALAGVDPTGLPMVASIERYPWFAAVKQPGTLPIGLAEMHDAIMASELLDWYDQINANTAPDPAVLPEVDATTFGVVTLNGPGGTRTAPIQTDPASGRLAYRFNSLPPGSYTLSAWLGYKSYDGVTRRYAMLTDSNRNEIGTSQTVVLPTTGSPTSVGQPLFLVC